MASVTALKASDLLMANMPYTSAHFSLMVGIRSLKVLAFKAQQYEPPLFAFDLTSLMALSILNSSNFDFVWSFMLQIFMFVPGQNVLF